MNPEILILLVLYFSVINANSSDVKPVCHYYIIIIRKGMKSSRIFCFKRVFGRTSMHMQICIFAKKD